MSLHWHACPALSAPNLRGPALPVSREGTRGQKRLDSAARINITPAPFRMSKIPFEQSVAKAVAQDPRYAPEAYAFLKDALEFTMRGRKKVRGRDPDHVTGPELCSGVRDYAVQQYGPMVPTLFEAWGIRSTRDIGEMVFNLIKAGAFSKSDSDRVEDFDHLFDFADAFVKPFLPARSRAAGSPGPA